MEKDPETFAIIGAAMEVHRELGRGFLELVYQTALALEFRGDFVCSENIVVETKAISKLTSADEAQLINQLKATGLHRGLLVNFGAPSLEYKRLVFGNSENVCKSAKSVHEIYL